MASRRFFSTLFAVSCCCLLLAQENPVNPPQKPYEEVRGTEPKDKPKYTTYAVIDNGDTIPMAYLTSTFVFPKETFKSERDEKYYWKLVRDVKRVYPLAKVVYFTLLETMDYLKTIPDERSRNKHLRLMEKDLIKEYEPVLRKMTYTQGKILLKLINRECNTSPYELIRAYRGSFTAFFWQGIARIFREDLKETYDPTGEDFLLERIIVKIDQGQL